jgi:hypothetical protein
VQLNFLSAGVVTSAIREPTKRAEPDFGRGVLSTSNGKPTFLEGASDETSDRNIGRIDDDRWSDCLRTAGVVWQA